MEKVVDKLKPAPVLISYETPFTNPVIPCYISTFTNLIVFLTNIRMLRACIILYLSLVMRSHGKRNVFIKLLVVIKKVML